MFPYQIRCVKGFRVRIVQLCVVHLLNPRPAIPASGLDSPPYNRDAQLSAAIRYECDGGIADRGWGLDTFGGGSHPSRGVGETRTSMAETDCRVWDLTCILQTLPSSEKSIIPDSYGSHRKCLAGLSAHSSIFLGI